METDRFRSRNSTVSDSGREWAMDGGSYLWNVVRSVNVITGQRTWDRKHNWPQDSGPMWDTGGSFTSEKFDYWHTYPKRMWLNNHWTNGHYDNGPFVPWTMSAAFGVDSGYWLQGGNLTPSTELELVSKGTTAISQCAPTNPHADLATTLGELRNEGLPALVGLNTLKGRGKPSAVAGEYLNYQFGVKPLISDLKKLAKAASESAKILEQYTRDSGRVIRRRYAFPSQVEASPEFGFRTGYKCQPVGLHYSFYEQEYGTLDRITTCSKRTWFSGAFTYHAVDKNSAAYGKVLSFAQQANHLLGIGITPNTLYNLTPWSWAVDWVSNLGDVINNASMFLTDGLVMRYGYVMEEFSRETTYRFSGAVLKNPRTPLLCDQTFSYTYKRRRAATPFGFGLKYEEFTPKQWAIIAALGITRGGSRLTLTQ